MPRRKGPARPPRAAVGVTETAVAWFTHRCGKKWRGVSRAHCGVCHETFGGVTGFDEHRRNGACLKPAAMGLEIRTIGESPETRYDVWVSPMTEEEVERVRGHEQLTAF